MTTTKVKQYLSQDRLFNSDSAVAGICMIVGLIQIIASHHAWFLWITLFVLSGAGFWGLARLLFSPHFVTAWSVFGVSISLSYGFGALNTMLSTYADGTLNMLILTYSTHHGLSMAAGGSAVITSILFFANNFDSHKIIPLEPMTDTNRITAFSLVAVITIGMVAALATGMLGFQGSQFVEEGSAQVSVFSSLVAASATPAMGLAALAYGKQPRSAHRWIMLFMCIILAATQLSTGRRVFMFNMLTTFIVLLAALDLRKIFTPRVVVMVLTTALVLGLASRYFVAMREAGYTLPETATLYDRMEAGWDLLLNSKTAGLDERIAENQRTRTFIIGYFGELIDAYQKVNRTTGGDVLLLNVAYSAPTSLFPGKWAIINQLGSDEILCHGLLGLPAWDAANSVATEGLCDFGWAGAIIYPPALAALLTLVNLAARRGPIEVRAIIASATIGSLLHTEGNLFGYLTNIRNVIILAALTWGFVWLVNKVLNMPLVRITIERRKETKLRMAANVSTQQARPLS